MSTGRPTGKTDAARAAPETGAVPPAGMGSAVPPAGMRDSRRGGSGRGGSGRGGSGRGGARKRVLPERPPDQLVLHSPAHFRALAHPLRHRLLNLLRQRPATLSQLASALGSTKGTVGYHVQLMVDAGLVRLAGTRRVRGGTERYYEPVGTVLRHDTDAAERTAFLVQAALDEMLPHRPGDEDIAVLRHVRLTPAQARDVAARIERYASDERLAEGAEQHGDPHGLLFCLYRADIPTLPPDPAP
jgi:DNA-binding transcriptional ArsR family regulator